MLGTALTSLVIFSNLLLAQNTTNIVATDGARLRQERREAIQAKRETTREEFQNRLQEIKNERKRNIVANVATRFENVKDKWVLHWKKYLERLDTLADKIEERYGTSTELSQARDAITQAQIAVDELSNKDYSINFEDESTLREDVKVVVDEFKTDLMTTKESVTSAKQSLQIVFRIAKENETDEQ